ncbi:hypothetical protein LDENG_00054820 [Lucifuga dentata]|nr:hypothetical protein LDENG_00054820 [Lucifuga dentata]
MMIENIEDVALLDIMIGCCITYKHGITQISVLTKETRTNSQQPSHLLIPPASKQKRHETHNTVRFNRLLHRFQPHKNPSNLPKLLII